jgi:hypothetical protein
MTLDDGILRRALHAAMQVFVLARTSQWSKVCLHTKARIGGQKKSDLE